jgi:L-lactate utilization protein LutC
MTPLETIKNNLIDRIMATKNEKILHAIEKLFESSKDEEMYNLSSQEIEMLAMSEADIANGNLVSEKELEEMDKKWLA